MRIRKRALVPVENSGRRIERDSDDREVVSGWARAVLDRLDEDLGGGYGAAATSGVYGYDDNVSHIDIHVVDVCGDPLELSFTGDGIALFCIDRHYTLEGPYLLGISEEGEPGQIRQ